MTTIAAVRDLLQTRGWHQGSYFSDTGAACLMGACCVADKQFPQQSVPFIQRAAIDLFPDRTQGGFEGTEVVHFNDHPDTTLADVMAVLARAEQLEQEGEQA